jgi:murein DD-endopeptidase MepM/ murein hydrolase activator NlpD
VSGALAGLFDGPTTIDVDWRAPIQSLSLSRLEPLGDEAVGIALLCLNSWGHGMREVADQGDARIVVRDESWKQLRLGVEAVKSFDSDMRLSRSTGDIQIAVGHKPSDPLSAGDASSQAVAIAKDLLHLADIKVLHGQDLAVAQELDRLLGLGPMPPFQQRYTRTSPFGRRFHPIYKEWRLHTGQDLTSVPGAGPVVAAAAGTVLSVGTRGAYGNMITLRHPGSITTRYGHLASIDRKIRPGAIVAIGQRLGVEGSTGASTGLHLHFQVEINGKPVNPVPFMADRGAPLNGTAIPASSNPPSLDTVRVGHQRLQRGEGFALPPPGRPRQNSLDNPPLPIPHKIKKLYVAAAAKYKIPWTLLAGIGMEETGHGRNNHTSSAGAQGLMQFMPGTWASTGVDGDGDGRADIHDDADSIYSAAHYLTKSGVAAADPLGLFDDPVETLGAGIGDILGERDQDGWPPGLDGFGQSGGLGQPGVDGGVVEVGQPPPDLRRLILGEQHPESFLHTPGGTNLVGRIMIIEHPAEPGPWPRREVFGGGEQQQPVHPHRVGNRAAATEQVASEALPDLGHHLVGQCDQMPLVDRDLGIR